MKKLVFFYFNKFQLNFVTSFGCFVIFQLRIISMKINQTSNAFEVKIFSSFLGNLSLVKKYVMKKNFAVVQFFCLAPLLKEFF